MENKKESIGEEAKKIIKENLPEEGKRKKETFEEFEKRFLKKTVFEANKLPDIPEGKAESVETVFKANVLPDVKGDKAFYTKPKKLSHPLRAYSMSMGEFDPLEDMVWNMLERIGFILVYKSSTAAELCFELGKIYMDFYQRLTTYIESKAEEMEEDKISLTITGKAQSGKSYILEKIYAFLTLEGIEVDHSPGKNIQTEHQLKITPIGDNDGRPT